MQNKQKREERVTKAAVRDIEHQRNWRRQRLADNKQDDRYQNGELLAAANILTELAAKRASQRNMMEQVKVYQEVRAGTYDHRHNDWNQAGFQPPPSEPPANWPLPKNEWPAIHSESDLLTKAATLIIAETERLTRAQQMLYRGGVNLLDDEYRELQNERSEIAENKRVQAWNFRNRNISKNAVKGEIELDAPIPVAYDQMDTPVEVDVYDSFDQTCDAHTESQF